MQIMKAKWREIPGLMSTHYGRRRIKRGLLARAKILIWPQAFLYRRTLIRKTKLVAVVGSFGKTTTTRAVACVLGLPLAKYIGMNSGVAVATGLLRILPFASYGVQEVGINSGGQMRGYARLLCPNVVVVTGIGTEHGTTLQTLENTREEKSAMVQALGPSGVAILNGDDPNVLWMKSRTRARCVTYGFHKQNDFRADCLSFDINSGTQFVLHAKEETFKVNTRLIGRHMVYPILAAIAVAAELGCDVNDTLQRLAKLQPISQRLEPVWISNGAFLLVDTLKSHLETIEAALTTLEELVANRKIVVMGEVEEPPGSHQDVYRKVGQRLAQVAQYVVFVGGNKRLKTLRSAATSAGMSQSAWQFAGRSARKAAELVQQILQPGDIVLIKGRSTQKLARVAYILQGQEISCDVPFCDYKPGCMECDKLKSPSRK
jgi:UDP-N-acetylmuramoyl-tripeptide--D-alanyl-D-alanine ligase